MQAKFMVERTYLLPSRSLFVLEGVTTEGTIRAGMKVRIGFNRSFSMVCAIEGVEFVRSANDERVALTVRYTEAEEGELLQSFNLIKEEVFVSSINILPLNPPSPNDIPDHDRTDG
jgi:hypothetical protein